jgi:hypothetical protein
VSGLLEVINAEWNAGYEPSDASEETNDEQDPEPHPLSTIIEFYIGISCLVAATASDSARLISLRALIVLSHWLLDNHLGLGLHVTLTIKVGLHHVGLVLHLHVLHLHLHLHLLLLHLKLFKLRVLGGKLRFFSLGIARLPVTLEANSSGFLSLNGDLEPVVEAGHAESRNLDDSLTHQLVVEHGVLVHQAHGEVIANVLHVVLKHFVEHGFFAAVFHNLGLKALHTVLNLNVGIHITKGVEVFFHSGLNNSNDQFSSSCHIRIIFMNFKLF